jgi:adenosylhomocysteine nucleosidase
MDKIRAKYPDVHAVDMETAAIAHVCCKFNVPFLSLRVVSDTPGVDAHTEQYQDFWDKLADRSFETIKQILISLINQK